MDVILYAHTHWDREWYKPFQEFRLRLIEVMDEIIAQLQKNQLNCFYLDGQTIALDDYLEIYPEKKELIMQFIKDKRLMIGPWYVLADEFLVSGESLIRNLLVGIKESKKLGCDDFVGYLPDAFGHSSEIPRILNSFGIKNALVWRGAGNKKSEFIWKSKDGSSVFTVHLIEGYFQDILNQNYSIQEKTKEIGKFLNKIKHHATTDTLLLPAGGDHLAPATYLDSQICGINEHINNYKLCEGCLTHYINIVKSKNPKLEAIEGELRDNSRSPILPGTLSARLYLKQNNAKATWKLSKQAEPLVSYLQLLDLIPDKKNELDYAWKLLLQNHPHDSICGCSVDEVHSEMMTRFRQVNQISGGLIGKCLYALSNRVEKGKLIIYNSSDYAFSGVLKIKTPEKLAGSLMKQYLGVKKEFPQEILFNPQRVPLQEDIKEYHEYLIWAEDIASHSINILDPDYEYKKHPTIVQTTSKFIKNSRIMLKVNDDGTLTLADSDSAKEFSNLHILHDLADKGDTYNFCPIKYDKPVRGTLARTEVVENGQLRGVLRLYYEMEIPESLDKDEKYRSFEFLTHLVIVDAIVHADSRRVEFKAMWENFSRDHILQLKFRLDEKIYRTVSENNFGLIERTFNPDYSLKAGMPAEKNQELKTNTAPMQRFVWANGLGIIAEGLPEYGVDGQDLYITLLRSVGKLSRGAIDTRGVPAGPPLNVPDAQCLGVQRLRYAICAVDDPAELFMEADNFMRSIIAEAGVAYDSSQENEILRDFITVNNHDIYTYAVKSPEDKGKKGLVVRLMNISDKVQNVIINSSYKFMWIGEVDSLERHISGKKIMGSEIRFMPHELKTLMLE